MRLLTVGNMYPPQHLGGYEVIWRYTVEHLRAAGHDTRVLTTDWRRPGASEADDADVHRELRWYWADHAFPRRSARQRLALERHNARVLDRHLRQTRADAVMWWGMGGMSLGLLERVRRRGIPAMGAVLDDWMLYGPRVDAWTAAWARRPRLAGTAERLAGVPTRVDLAGAAHWCFVSAFTRDVAQRGLGTGVRRWSSEVVHPGIDPAIFRVASERPWTGELAYVGRIDERKGIAVAIRAMAALPGTRLTVTGDGDDGHLAELRALAAGLGVGDRVVFAPGVPRERLPGVYAAADAVLFPVVWDEPWGLVPLEAMSVGRPVIATGTGGSGEYLRHAANALLSPPGDDAALAAAVQRLAGDAGLRGAIRDGGLHTAARFTEEGYARALERIVAGRVLSPAARAPAAAR